MANLISSAVRFEDFSGLGVSSGPAVIVDSQVNRDGADMVASNSHPFAGSDVNRKLTADHLGKIVDWLEDADNFAMLNGSSRRVPVGTRHPSKKTVFKLMLVHLHANGFPKFVATGDNLGKRFQRYVKKYKEALAIKNDSGAGLSMAELRAGITLEDKLDKICPHFERMHALYGERANVAPPATASVGLPGLPELFVDAGSEDEDQDDYEGVAEQDSMAPDIREEGGESQFDFEPTTTDNPHPQTVPNVTASQANDVRGARPEANQTASGDHTFCYTQDGQASRAPAAPPSNATGDRSNHNKRNGRKQGPQQATSRPNLAEVYMEKLVEKNVFRQQLIETKDKWKTQELADRREARELSAKDSRQRDRLQRKHDEKRARIDLDIQLTLLRAQQSAALFTELIRSNRTPAEMLTLMQVIPGLNEGLSSPGLHTPNQPPRARTNATTAPTEDEVVDLH